MNALVSKYTRNCLCLRRLQRFPAHARCFHDVGGGLRTIGAATYYDDYPRLSAACAGECRGKSLPLFLQDKPSSDLALAPSWKREQNAKFDSTVGQICRTTSLTRCSTDTNIKYPELCSIRADRNCGDHDTSLANDFTSRVTDSHRGAVCSQTTSTMRSQNHNICRTCASCRSVLTITASSCISSNLLSCARMASLINVRSIRTNAYACQEDKQDLGCKQNQNEDGSNPEVVEWVHPDQRTDSILGKDPELKSLLRELASDFGRDEKLPAERDREHDVKTASAQNSDQIKESKAEEEEYNEPSATEGRLKDPELRITAGDVDCDNTLQPISISETPEKKFVFSIDDMVALLREENAQDICVIKIPKETHYVDFFIVATGRSPRHLKAMSLFINQQYKARKTKRDAFILVEGENTDDWICMDFGNIVVHLMSEEMREFYELEKLWTLGPGYDDQLQRLREYEAKLKETLSLNEVKAGSDNSSSSLSAPTKSDNEPEVSFVK